MVAAPGLTVEMGRAKEQGTPILGCCPNTAHKRGFHMRPEQILPGDYSLRTALNKPVGQHCCAIDIGTTAPLMRRYVKTMFERWDAGAQPPDMAEFIGSPDGRRVLYASFENPGRVELYRGTGHDVWFHGSKFRSLAGKDGRWLDRTGPYLGPLLGEEDALMAVSDKEWADLVGKVNRLNSQMDRTDAIIAGNTAFKGSNLQEQFAAVNKRLDAVNARLDSLVSPGGGTAPAAAAPVTPASKPK
jgi:hypothetical protein